MLAGLIALGIIPILANLLRRIALSLGAGDPSPSDAAPVAVLLHVTASTVFVILGALQFSARIRQRSPSWHRNAGRLVLGAGTLAAGTGLWLSETATHAGGPGELLHLFRLLAGIGMLSSLALGFAAILRHDVARHRAWMTRAYAIGLGAGTQVLTLGFGGILFGQTSLSVALLNGAGWAINLTVAEVAIRGRCGSGTAGT